jgi:hypothetical protein
MHNEIPAAFPLKIGSSRRFLVDQKDQPFLVHGDAAWSMITALNEEEVKLFLANRAQKGLNALIVNLVEHKFNGPFTQSGLHPFRDPHDLSTPNDAYFDYAARIVQLAAEYGIVVFLAPLYLGARTPKNDEGWFIEAMMTGPHGCSAYGQYVGKRFASLDNIIWLLGCDRNPGEVQDHIIALVHGMKKHDQRHLYTAHPAADVQTADVYGKGNWLDIHTTYSYGIVHKHLMRDYNSEPATPFVLTESTYEGEHNSTPVQIRRQAYWALLCGACGQFMGNNPIWAFWPGWQQAMDAEASCDMAHLKDLFLSRAWETLIPDQFSHKPWFELDFSEEGRVVVSGLGEQTGLDFLGAAYTANRGTLIAYLPTPRTLTVNLSRLAGEIKRQWWFNPRTGDVQAGGEVNGQGLHEFTPPGAEDWVLVIDDKALALPPPGDGH